VTSGEGWQSFEDETSPDQGPPRLAALRAAMGAEGLAGFLVPRADVHQGEEVAPSDERLAWLTGFTGSAGFCVVLRDAAGLFVDGRYRVQARAQAAEEFQIVPWPETKPAEWIGERVDAGEVGYDPWLHTAREVEALREGLGTLGLRAAPNLVDRIWSDRPAPPDAPFFPYPAELAGETAEAKRARIAEALRAEGEACAVLTLPASIAWLLNIRGADVARTPAPHAFAVIHADGRCDLFARGAKAEPVADHLGPDVAALAAEAFPAALGALSGPVRVDPATAPEAVFRALEEAGVKVSRGADPCILPKARKTEAELAGAREAGDRDAAAVVRFLAWLDATAPGDLTEIAVVRALEGFRRESNLLRGISFDTIAGSGPNGAIVHYRVTRGTDRALREGELLLIDSGGQYLDGTTDVTRTVPIGEVPRSVRETFTRVLRGMIAVSRGRFPKGVAGAHLDALARQFLWAAGQDYDHGTGHGVGHYLGVHEGPAGLSRRATTPLEPGMIVSNEPGHYREGAHGIRIENLLAVREAEAIPGGDERAMLDFETLTHVPIDRRLIVPEMLHSEERAWLDAYHAETARRLAPRLEGEAATWLERATAPL
jgi:Xaa-Pro aminopeptidase